MTIKPRYWFFAGVGIGLLLAIVGLWSWAVFAFVFSAFATIGQAKLDTQNANR